MPRQSNIVKYDTWTNLSLIDVVGCLNGGGQPIPDSNMNLKHYAIKLEESYNSLR